MDGVLLVDKPLGPTSHDVVAKVRRALDIDKVGHTGTLDPMASGVLPLVLGRGTKLARYLACKSKTYHACIQLGKTTDTLDAEGKILTTSEVQAFDLAQIDAVLASFLGITTQIPPMYSAKKIAGKKLYELARQGLEVARKAQTIEIFDVRRQTYANGVLTFEVRCSAGTYIRVLAEDIGKKLGCGAYLTALRRLQVGDFTLDGAMALDALLEDPTRAKQHVIPLGRALADLPRIDLDAGLGRRVMTGHQLSVADVRILATPEFDSDETLTLGMEGGDIIAVVRSELARRQMPCMHRDRRVFKTERVLAHPGPPMA